MYCDNAHRSMQHCLTLNKLNFNYKTDYTSLLCCKFLKIALVMSEFFQYSQSVLSITIQGDFQFAKLYNC